MAANTFPTKFSVQEIFNRIFDPDTNIINTNASGTSGSGGAVTGTIQGSSAAAAAMTITLASLANSAAGVGRQSTIVDNTTSKYLSALVSLKVTVGTSPTANTLIYVYLIRDNNDGTPIRDDGAGASDAGLTIVNAPLLGTILVPATTSDTAYYGLFDTSQYGPLGPKWGIAVVNNSGAALNATGGNHVVSFVGIKRAIA